MHSFAAVLRTCFQVVPSVVNELVSRCKYTQYLKNPCPTGKWGMHAPKMSTLVDHRERRAEPTLLDCHEPRAE